MKKLLFAVSALAALSLLAPSAGFAQYNNHMGIYTAEGGVNTTSDNLVTNTVYFVITNPYNDDEGHAVEWIHGYEGMVTIDGTGLVLAVRWPVDALNVGSNTNQIVAFGLTDVHVVEGAATVAEMDIIYMDGTGGPLTLTLGPADPTSTPGMMAFLDADAAGSGLVPMMTSAGNWANPVFGINMGDNPVVSTDNSSFDNIKAMYR